MDSRNNRGLKGNAVKHFQAACFRCADSVFFFFFFAVGQRMPGFPSGLSQRSSGDSAHQIPLETLSSFASLPL
jgi:hypothetical protein